jgi:APA family basic amino acid/polyamine antiporter
MNFLFFGLTALALFVLRRRDRLAGLPEAQDRFRTPGHPWTTALFILASLLVVASSFWAYPINSLIGYAILLIGVPPFLFWRRRRTREAASYP